jgi:DNA invertase Pin-like site-specific DNA recombinase
MSAKLIGYARVSTADQHLTPQLQQLNFAGCDCVYQEKASGADDDRKELARAISYAQAGDTLVVCKLDRVARSTKKLLNMVEDLTAKGVAFRVLNINLDTSTPTGKMMMTILAAIATFEREIMLERQSEGIDRARTAGLYKGRTPVIREQATPQVLEMRRQGIPHRDIARELQIGIATVYRICKLAAGGAV